MNGSASVDPAQPVHLRHAVPAGTTRRSGAEQRHGPKTPARIPLEQPHTLVARLRSSGKKENVDFRYVERKRGARDLPYEDVAAEWLDESNKWLARYNPAYIATDHDRPPPGAQVAGGNSPPGS